MRTLITLLLLVGACAGDSPGGSSSGRTCDGTLYDHCLSEHDCGATDPDCRNFMADGFQVCSKSCTVGDDASCGMTLDGRAATCNTMGICKPPAANDCVAP
jgi:hypothetical protein